MKLIVVGPFLLGFAIGAGIHLALGYSVRRAHAIAAEEACRTIVEAGLVQSCTLLK